MADSFPLPPRLLAILQDMPLEELAFVPVPVRARHDGWTAERQHGFVHRLALCGSVSTAARAIGMTRKSAYRLRERPGAEGFAAAWDRAIGWGRSSQVDRAIERAILGEVRPVFYRGRKCGEQVHYHTGLTLAVLKLIDRERSGSGWQRSDREAWDY